MFLLLSSGLLIGCEDDETPIDPFANAIKHGSIVVTLSGIGPDGNPFSETVDYKYMPELSFEYSIANPAFEDSNGIVFTIKRRATAIDEIGAGGYWAEAILYANHDASEPTFPIKQLSVSMNVLDEESRGYFEVSANFTTGTISDYHYDANTGELKFKMLSALPQEDHNLSGDLLLTAEVDVTVFKYIMGS